MKFFGASTALALCALCGLTAADISLKQPARFEESNYGNSRYQIFEVHNHYQSKNFAYLPPAVASTQATEEIHIHHAAQPQQQQQQEVVTAAVTSAIEDDDNLDLSFISFADGGHVQAQPQPQSQATVAAVPQQTLPVSVAVPFPSNYQHDFQQQQQVQQSYSAAAYLPPTVATPTRAQHQQQQPLQQQQIYQASSSGSNSLNSQAPQQFTQPAETYPAPDYLPPSIGNVAQQQAQQQHYQSTVSSSSSSTATQQFAAQSYRGAEYLPPTAASLLPQQQQSQLVSKSSYATQPQQQQVYRGPTYLPPSGDSSSSVNSNSQLSSSSSSSSSSVSSQSSYHAPGYLPPGYDFSNPQEQLNSQPQLQTLALPLTQPQQQQLAAVTQATQPLAAAATAAYRAPEYLPPGYDFAHPDRLPLEQIVDQPVSVAEPIANVQPAAATLPDYRAPGYLPPNYESSKPLPQQQLQANILYQAPQQQQTLSQQQLQTAPQQLAQHPGALPDGYDFTKPENSEAAIAELHSLQTQTKLLKQQQEQQRLQQQQQQVQYQQQQQQQQQQQHNHRQVTLLGSNIVYGVPKPNQQPLPPQQHIHHHHHHRLQLQHQHQQHVPTTKLTASTAYQAPLPAAVASPVPVAVPAVAPLIAPPATPAAQHTHIHTLSSYMNTVQPLARYGLPQQQRHVQQHHVQQQQQHPQFVEVAPMYRGQTKRPRYYAPAMSYTSNALPATRYQQHYHQQQQQQHIRSHAQQHVLQHVQQHAPQLVQQQLPRVTLNLQAQQSLQKFMPREVQMAVNVAVAAAGPVSPGSSKVRTVQIVKPNELRTFRVLETLDAGGVKTIKILGTSNVQPTGQHHTVKVVLQNANNAESHVQTVKIYDDQQEYAQQPSLLPQLPQVPQVTHTYLPAARPRRDAVRREAEH